MTSGQAWHFQVITTDDDGNEVATDAMSARGGGFAAMVGLLLRVTFILLHRQ